VGIDPVKVGVWPISAGSRLMSATTTVQSPSLTKRERLHWNFATQT
jgi:hypothetical protein